MKKICVFSALLTLLFAAMFVRQGICSDEAGEISISPMIGGYWFDNAQNIEKDLMGSLGIGYNFTDHIGLELTGGYGQFDCSYFDPITCECADDDLDAYKIHLDGIYNLMPDKRFSPYLAVGVGAVNVDGDAYDDDYTMVNYGGGVKYFISEDFAIRADARHIYDIEDSRNNGAVMIGIVYQFGGRKKVAAKEAPVEPEPVAPTVAPEPTPAPEPAPEPTHEPEPKQILSIDLQIQFDFDKAVVKPKYHDRIQKIAGFLKDHPDTTAKIEGHTCAIGPEVYNQKLSQRRADAVRGYLIKHFNISPSRLTSRGFGESRPLADNSTIEGRRINRRVLVVVSNTTSNSSSYLKEASEQTMSLFQHTGDAGVFDGVRLDRDGDKLKLTFMANVPILNFNSFILEEPNRIVIDLPGKWENKGASVYEFDDALVNQIRIGDNEHFLRVVLEVNEEIEKMPSIDPDREGLLLSVEKTGRGFTIVRK